MTQPAEPSPERKITRGCLGVALLLVVLLVIFVSQTGWNLLTFALVGLLALAIITVIVVNGPWAAR